jgi:hypothetical protein
VNRLLEAKLADLFPCASGIYGRFWQSRHLPKSMASNEEGADADVVFASDSSFVIDWFCRSRNVAMLIIRSTPFPIVP